MLSSQLIILKCRSCCIKTILRHCTSESALDALKYDECGSKQDCQTKLKNQPRRRVNALGIQMLSEPLHKQIFGGLEPIVTQDNIDKSIAHLETHKLWHRKCDTLKDVDMKLPPLYGSNIDEHFRELGQQQSGRYRELCEHLSNAKIPPTPEEWQYREGWTRYNSDGTWSAVIAPNEPAFILDVERCVPAGKLPTLATAVSDKAWYSWCSKYLVDATSTYPDTDTLTGRCIRPYHLIPLPPCTAHRHEPRAIIGHNVSYDRKFISEQYSLDLEQTDGTRFVDTMSLHIACSGISSYQRALSNATKTGNYDSKAVLSAQKKTSRFGRNSGFRGPPRLYWMNVGSANSLNEVYALYTKGKVLSKEPRALFVKGSLEEIREQFQYLVSYCAKDAIATHELSTHLLPMFFQRFPHPVTFAGMLEMSQMLLPVDDTWRQYITRSQRAYDGVEHKLKLSLMDAADKALEYMADSKYKSDPWLWDCDWSLKKKRKRKNSPDVEQKDIDANVDADDILTNPDLQPKWYRDLSSKPGDPEPPAARGGRAGGASKISIQTRVTPKVLRMTWRSYPVHHNRKYGWGYLLPGRKVGGGGEEDSGSSSQGEETADPHAPTFPLKEAVEWVQRVSGSSAPALSPSDVTDIYDTLRTSFPEDVPGTDDTEIQWELLRQAELDTSTEKSKKKKKKKPSADSVGAPGHEGNGPYKEVDVPGCWFYKLPHKDGKEANVGCVLTKGFIPKLEDGTLRINTPGDTTEALLASKQTWYWRNANKRINSQLVVWLPGTDDQQQQPPQQAVGVILPEVVMAGTLTRRAMEPLWLTASNAYPDRIGSELKGMVRAPHGYHFVGADVDSQELWIASLLGDASFAGMHGCTAFGWMTLQGKKEECTDLHSLTAETVGITRDQAKIMNYGRIYGAGMLFAKQMLQTFNPSLSTKEASDKARIMYTLTKGRKVDVTEEEVDGAAGGSEDGVARRWAGGTESDMFNKLESIAHSVHPHTPTLHCRITRALEPGVVGDDFMTSRINWVVQSSAVDYLHLMLVCMRWLCETYEIQARFSISIHDEVRYLVRSEDRYRAALALQITNLLTRSLFAFKVGITDLPQSVAFFSAVDIDKVLRKEVTMECVTPSNPKGLKGGYGIDKGEALNIHDLLDKVATLEKSDTEE